MTAHINPVTENAVNLFTSGVSVEDIASQLNITERSVITRLSLKGVYVKPEKAKTETRKHGVKAELIQQLNDALETDFEDLKNLRIATLEAILAKVTTN
jgi:hypothetical protein